MAALMKVASSAEMTICMPSGSSGSSWSSWLADVGRDGDGVGLRLAQNAQADGVAAIGADDRVPILDAELDLGDLAQRIG